MDFTDIVCFETLKGILSEVYFSCTKQNWMSCCPKCILDPVIKDYLGFFFLLGNSLYFVMEKMRTIRMFSRLDTRCQNTEDVCSGRLIIFPIPSTVQSFWFTISAFLGAKLLSLKTPIHGTWSSISIQPWHIGKTPFQRSVCNETGRTNFQKGIKFF